MKKTLLISSLALANWVLSTPALAGGQNEPSYRHGEHAAAAPHLFTGFSVTGALGGINGNADIQQDATMVTEVESGFQVAEHFKHDLDLSETSFAGMIALEYDYQFSSGLVFGLALTAGYDDLEIKNSDTEVVHQSQDRGEFGSNDTSTLTTTFKTTLENDFAILFKPGFVVRHNTLLYALIGPRWGNFETRLSGTVNTHGEAHEGPMHASWDVTASDSDKTSGYHVGFTAGAGIQQALTDHVRLGIEYTYTRYANLDELKVFDVNMNPPTQVVPALAVVDATVDEFNVVTNTVMATLSYKF